MSDTLLVVAPILACVVTGVLTMAVDAFDRPRAAVFVAVVGAVVATGFAGYAAWTLEGSTIAYDVFLGGPGLSGASAGVLVLSALALFGGSSSLAGRPGGPVNAALMVFAAGAAVALAQSIDLVMSVIALETIAVCAYALVASGYSARSSEAAMKYLIQGALSSGLLLLGVAILFGLYGGVSAFIALAESPTGSPLLPGAVGGTLVLVAYSFKLGAAPFHSWAPDAFETAPPSNGAFLAGAPKVGALTGAFVLVAVVLANNVENLAYQIGVIAALSVVVGNLGGLRQTSYTRLLGYSGIAQVGYALTGLAVGVAAGEGQVGYMLPLTLVLILSYGLAAVGAFLIADIVRGVRPEWDGSLEGMAGLGKERPLLGVSAAVLMFSLTGIPLTLGFWGKLLVFGEAILIGWTWLAAICVIGSVVSFGYYGNVLRWLFFESSEGVPTAGDGETERITTATLPPRVAVSMIALTVVILGIMPLFTGVEALLSVFS